MSDDAPLLPPSAWVARALHASRDARVVSVDVFDTLLYRVVGQPDDVFRLVEREQGDDGFHARRVEAERRARARRAIEGVFEVTLDDVYAELPGCTPDAELAAERAVCRVNPEIAGFVRACAARGQRVVLLSDMYLPGARIRALVEGCCDALPVERVFSSADTGRTKAAGSAFTLVCDEMGVDPEVLFHVGDHVVSDWANPRRAGARAMLYARRAPAMRSTAFLNRGHVRRLRAARRRPAARAVEATLVDSWVADPRLDDYWFHLGRTVVGPLVAGWTAWIRARARAHGVERVYFLARDGYLPRRAMSVLFSDVEHDYVYASRRMTLLASLTSLDDPRAFKLLTSGHGGHRPLYMLDRLLIEYDAEDARRRVRTVMDPDATLGWDDPRADAVVEALAPMILDAAARERADALAYFESLGMTAGGVHALVDVGWNGSVQRGVERLLGRDFAGYYLALRAGAHANRFTSAYVTGFPPTQAAIKRAHNSVEVHEFLLGAPHATTIRVRRRDDGYEPVLGEPNHVHERCARGVERGVMDFVGRIRPTAAESLVDDPETAMAGLNALLLHPTTRDIGEWSAISHEVDVGKSASRPLLPKADLKRVLLGRRAPGYTTHRMWPIAVAAQAGIRMPHVGDEYFARFVRFFVAWRDMGTAKTASEYWKHFTGRPD